MASRIGSRAGGRGEARSQEAGKRRDELLEHLLATADRALDQAQVRGRGVEGRLERARRRSELIGRDPVIEDAKLAIARRCGCTPSDAFRILQRMSQYQNRKLREVARDVDHDRAHQQGQTA